MSNYEEFMKSAYIRRYACGIKNKPQTNTLKNAYEKEKPDMSPERMERLETMLKKSQIGRETLAFLDEKKTKLGFEEMKYYGYFSPDENRVALNPEFSDEDLAITFIHEMRHARQDSIMKNTSSEMTPETLLKNGFMIEADACAAECVFAHQMKELGDDSILKAHQKTVYAPMSTAFEREFAKSHDMDKARNAAFLEWYKLPVKPGYADSYVDFMGLVSYQGESSDFRKDMDAKTMAQKLCLNSDGECYVSNPKLLELPERLHLTEKQTEKMVKDLKVFMKKFDRSADKLGLDHIYVAHRDGSYSTVREEMKIINAKNAVKNAAKGRKGRGGR